MILMLIRPPVSFESSNGSCKLYNLGLGLGYKPIARVDVDNIAFSSSLFSDKVDNTDGLNQLQINAFGCIVQGSFLTYMYSVDRHSRRSSSSRNRTGKPYAAHLARLDYLLIYLPTQVQLTYENQ